MNREVKSLFDDTYRALRDSGVSKNKVEDLLFGKGLGCYKWRFHIKWLNEFLLKRIRENRCI